MAEIEGCEFWRIKEHFEDRRYAENVVHDGFDAAEVLRALRDNGGAAITEVQSHGRISVWLKGGLSLYAASAFLGFATPWNSSGRWASISEAPPSTSIN